MLPGCSVPAGMTPITVNGCVFNVTLRPMMLGSAPKRVRHRRSLMTTCRSVAGNLRLEVEFAPDLRMKTEHTKIAGSDSEAVEVNGLALAGELHVAAREGCDGLKRNGCVHGNRESPMD